MKLRYQEKRSPMSPLHRLDTLLKTAFDAFNAKSAEPGGDPNPFYISTDEIGRKLDGMLRSPSELPALERLSEKLRLDAREQMILLTLFAPEADAAYERIYAYLQDDLNKKYPTVHLLTGLLCDTPEEKTALLEYFARDSKLSLLKLIEFLPLAAHTPKFQLPLRIAPPLRDYLLCGTLGQEALPEYCRILEPVDATAAEASLERRIETGIGEERRYLLNVHGTSEADKRDRALALASHFGFGLLCVDTLRAVEAGAFASVAALCRDALLGGTLLYFEGFEAYAQNERSDETALFATLGRTAWLTFFSTRLPWHPSRLPETQIFYHLAAAPMEEETLTAAWHDALFPLAPELAAESAPELAALFRFTRDDIGDVARLLGARIAMGERPDRELLWRLCRTRVRGDLGRYAQHLSSSNTLDDIVLPETQKAQLGDIIAHHRHRSKVFGEWGFGRYFQSRGMGVLFSGASGTGKTMAASILARALDLELYRIELSQIVSKYIGETEKNLSAIFEAAEASGVILFFDEADAVFGKRTEVKDAHDRYANIEVSYLLQKIESYDGLVILASNFKENIDDAFLRRLRFVVDFPMPNEAQRETIWRRLLDASLPRESIDTAWLAKRFKLSGANIRNVMLYAAFDAAQGGHSVTMETIASGIRKELRKIGQSWSEKDFEGMISEGVTPPLTKDG